MAVCTHGRLYPWPSVPISDCTHGRLYPWPSVPMAVCTHGRLYPWPAVPMAGCTHGRLYPWPSVPMAGCTHGRLYQWPSVNICLTNKLNIIITKLKLYTHVHTCERDCVKLPCLLTLAVRSWNVFFGFQKRYSGTPTFYVCAASKAARGLKL